MLLYRIFFLLYIPTLSPADDVPLLTASWDKLCDPRQHPSSGPPSKVSLPHPAPTLQHNRIYHNLTTEELTTFSVFSLCHLTGNPVPICSYPTISERQSSRTLRATKHIHGASAECCSRLQDQNRIQTSRIIAISQPRGHGTVLALEYRVMRGCSTHTEP